MSWTLRAVVLGDLKTNALWPVLEKEPWIRAQRTGVLTWLFLVASLSECPLKGYVLCRWVVLYPLSFEDLSIP